MTVKAAASRIPRVTRLRNSSSPTTTANVPYVASPLVVVLATYLAPANLTSSNTTAPKTAPLTTRDSGVGTRARPVNRNRKTTTSTAPPTTYASTFVRTEAPGSWSMPRKDTTASVEAVATMLTPTDAAMTANSPTSTTTSRIFATTRLPAETFWCQMVRMASRRPAIQPRPDSSVPMIPRRPALPLLFATTSPTVLATPWGRKPEKPLTISGRALSPSA